MSKTVFPHTARPLKPAPQLQADIAQAIRKALAITSGNMLFFTDAFKASTSRDGIYPQSENVEWTTGFCTGEYWLAYELTGDDLFRTTALLHVGSFERRMDLKIDVDHHDMGFLYTPSCVAAYRLTASPAGRDAALKAASHLMGRFHEKGGFIQAWGPLGEASHYRLIIDCLLNLPLLYWASDISGKPEYAEVARIHTRTSLKTLVRPDDSTYHTYYFDPDSGKPLHGVTCQGYRNDSAWARGQAWGIYGMALSYRYTGDEECLDYFRRITDFFLARLPQDHVPFWDLEFTDGSTEPRDSSAAAIAVCGIMEMLPFLGAEEAVRYHGAAMDILSSLISSYAVQEVRPGAGLLAHGTYAKHSPYNTIPTDRGVDECTTWGDYFYLEALVRASRSWTPYW